MFQSSGGKTSASDTFFVSDKDIRRKGSQSGHKCYSYGVKRHIGVKQGGNSLIEVVIGAETQGCREKADKQAHY